MREDELEIGPDIEELGAQLGWLEGLARRLVADPEEARDLVQDTMLAALQAPPRSQVGLRAWLATVLRRRRLRRPRRLAALDFEPADSGDPAARLRTQRLLIDAVLGLPAPYRLVLLRRYWDGWPPRRIARELALPVETVRSRHQRALALLRQTLDLELGDRRSWALVLPALVAVERGSLPGLAAILKGASLVTLKKSQVAIVGLLIGLVALVVVSTSRVEEEAALDRGLNSPEITRRPRREPEVRPAPVEDRAEASRTVLAVVETSLTTVLGRVVEAGSHAPVGGAQVDCVYQGVTVVGGSPERHRAVVTTTADGGFRLDLVGLDAAAGLRLVARHEDYVPSWDLGPLRIEKIDDAWRLADDLELRRGLRVAGRVLRARDRSPVAAAAVLESSSLLDGFVLRRARVVARSDRDGRFATEWPIEVRPLSGALFVISTEGVGWCRLALPIDRTLPPELEFLVHDGVDCEVRVVDLQGRPVPGAEVVVLPRYAPLWYDPRSVVDRWHGAGGGTEVADRFRAIADADGRACFGALPIEEAWNDPADQARFVGSRRPYVVQARARGFEANTLDGVDLADPAARIVVLRLGPSEARRLGGRIHDRGGLPIAGARIEAGGSMTTSAADGRYEIGIPVAHDGVTLRVSAAGFAPERRLVNGLRATPIKDGLDVELRPQVITTGELVYHDGAPLPGVVIRFEAHDRGDLEPRLVEVRTDSTGSFATKELTAGDWKVSYPLPSDSEYETILGTTTIIRGGDQALRIVASLRRRGRVVADLDLVDLDTGAPLQPDEAWAVDLGDDLARSRRAHPFRGPDLRATGLRAGRWLVRGQAGDRKFRQEFEVAPGELETKVVVRLGRPATLRGRVDLAALPPASRSEGVMLLSDPPGEGYSIRGDGTRFQGGCLVGADGDFVLTGVTPGTRITLRSETDFVSCEASLEIPQEGGEQRLDLVARPAGMLEVERDDSGGGSVLVEIVGPGDDLSVQRRWIGETPEALSLLPGTYQWRARLRPDYLRSGEAAEVSREGRVEITLGQTRRIRLEPR